jgi:hypothetical protein
MILINNLWLYIFFWSKLKNLLVFNVKEKWTMIIPSSDYLYGFVYGNQFPIATSVKIKFLVNFS